MTSAVGQRHGTRLLVEFLTQDLSEGAAMARAFGLT
jgi:hypothetical protein